MAAPPVLKSEALAGGGEMGALMRAKDWSETPLGPPETWPQSLLTSVSVCLNCAFPIVLWWGPELVLLYNDEYRPALGSAKHPAALGRPGADVWAEIWTVIDPMLRQVMETGEAVRARDLRLLMDRNVDEEETYFSFSYSPIRDETGGIGGVFCPVIETTAKVIGERRLRTLAELGRQALAKTAAEACRISAGIFAQNPLDVPFAVIYLLNEDGQSMDLAGSAGVVAGSPAALPKIDVLKDAPDGWPLVEPLRTGKFALVSDVKGRFPNIGRGKWNREPHSAIIIPIVVPGRERAPAVLIAGISPQRPFDEDYRSFFELAADQLATALSEVFAYEHERQRAQALAEIDRQKTAFFSNVSHEFRTPLTLLLSPLEELLATAGSNMTEEHRGLLQVAWRNARRLLRLVNTLLDYSRVEAGRAQGTFEPVDLPATTAELASNFRSLCEQAGLTLSVDCPPLDQPVYIDRDMWEKIVLNLLSNAFKFTLKGGIDVKLAREGSVVRLTVRDTGVGIPADQIPNIFERFHRIEGTVGRSFEGSGIGLALVHELVKLHGGRASVESKRGSGSVFTVALPLGSAHLPVDRLNRGTTVGPSSNARVTIEEAEGWLPGSERAVPQALSRAASNGVRRRKILLADDNRDMRDYVCRLLQKEGYEVTLAADGAEALASLRTNAPDLVVADVMMPKLDGFGLLRAIRETPSAGDLPVILLSARAGEEARVEGIEAGANDYLTKPFAPRELVARVAAQFDIALRHSEPKRRAEERIRELSAETGHLRQLFMQAPGFVAVVRGPEHIFEMHNPAYGELIGRRAVIGKSVREAMPEVEGQGYFELLDDVLRTGKPFIGNAMRVVLQHRTDALPEELFVDFVYQPIVEADGSVSGILVEGNDVTARVKAEARQRLMLDELNHRVKNTLATVQSIAQQTFRNAPSADEGRASFESRLLALSKTHDALTRANWEGADLGDILRHEMEPYGSAQIHLGGPSVDLPPRVALSLGMVFHELATNAAKYGSLSAPGGRVDVTWTLERKDGAPRPLRLTWREAGGPKVVPPTRKGFGSRVIELSIGGELDGELNSAYEPNGFRCEIEIPTESWRAQ